MNYYFENYVDPRALYEFLDKLGLVAVEGKTGLWHSILDSFGLIVSSPEKCYEVGFGVFNMLGALVQFFGVLFLSQFLANRFGKKRVFIYQIRCAQNVDIEWIKMEWTYHSRLSLDLMEIKSQILT
jgi:hypothetical protein